MNKKLIIIIAAVVVVVAAGIAVIFIFGGDKELPYVRTEYSPGEYFVTNIKDTNRLAKVTIVLELNTDTLTEMLEARNSELRDIIITFLRGQDLEAFEAVDLSPMKRSLALELNKKLEIDNITGILFSDLALQ